MWKGSSKLNEKYIPCILWFIIVFIIVGRYLHFPFSSPPNGDEPFYINEIDYLARYGWYNSLSQGNSFFYLLLVFLFSKVCFVSFLTSARILSALFFIVCCRLFVKCFERFANVSYADKYVALTFFCVIASGWVMKGLPDLVCVACMLGAFLLATGAGTYRRVIFAGLLLFIGFAVKPIALFAFPALALFLFLNGLKKEGWGKGVIKSILFSGSFVLSFVAYHVPGYMAYHKIMLEDKNHIYSGAQRIQSTTTWGERNTYYELYNLHHKPNKWAITWGEVDSFKQQHPEINLNVSFGQYVSNNTGAWLKHICANVFLALPYSINHGFFFAKWTSINKVINNFIIIKLLSLVLIAGICLFEFKFIRSNLLLLFVPFLFYLGLSCYITTQLEDNWLLFCLPFLALPVVKFLMRYVNVFVLLALQFVYLLI